MPELGKEALLGRLRDEGFSSVLVNRIKELLEAFNGNIQQFVIATKGQLTATYAKLHPETKLKGLGLKTYTVFDRFVRLYRESLVDAREQAKAVVEEQERKEAEKAEMREQILDGIVDFDALTTAMAALGTLGLKSCELGKLLEMHALALKARGGSQ